jgi:hypothetical protein
MLSGACKLWVNSPPRTLYKYGSAAASILFPYCWSYVSAAAD